MRVLYFLGLVILIGGCASVATQRYNERVAYLDKEYGSQLIFEKSECDAYKKSGKPLDGPLAYAACVRLLTVEMREKSDPIIKNCVMKKNAPINSCVDQIKALTDQYAAKQVLRYKYGNFQEADLRCKAEGDCATGVTYELTLLSTHNKAVIEGYRSELSQVQGAYAEESSRTRRAIAGALQSMGDGLQRSSQRQVNCTTTSFGNTATTNCY